MDRRGGPFPVPIGSPVRRASVPRLPGAAVRRHPYYARDRPESRDFSKILPNAIAEAIPEQKTKISVASDHPKRAGMYSVKKLPGRWAMKMMNMPMPRKKSRRGSRLRAVRGKSVVVGIWFNSSPYWQFIGLFELSSAQMECISIGFGIIKTGPPVLRIVILMPARIVAFFQQGFSFGGKTSAQG